MLLYAARKKHNAAFFATVSPASLRPGMIMEGLIHCSFFRLFNSIWSENQKKNYCIQLFLTNVEEHFWRIKITIAILPFLPFLGREMLDLSLSLYMSQGMNVCLHIKKACSITVVSHLLFLPSIASSVPE